MATFSPAFLDSIRRRVAVSDVIGRYAKLEKRGSNILACCPFHNEKTPSFYIYDTDGHYHCYGCKAHGDIFTFLMEKRGLNFPEAVEELAGQAGVPMPRESEMNPEDQLAREQRELYFEIMENAAKFYETQLKANDGRQAYQYVVDRGLSPQTSEQFRLGYAPRGNALYKSLQAAGYKTDDMIAVGLVKESTRTPGEHYDYFRDRLMFPIWDQKGRVIAFGGRILGQGEPKYLNSPETPLFKKSETVYAYHFARKNKAKDESFILVEGYMDVIALHQGGFLGAVAPLGTSITEAQLRLLWRADTQPKICLDGDKAGQKAAVRAMEIALPLIRPNQTLQFVGMPEGQDPDNLLKAGQRDDLVALLESPQAFADKLWNQCLSGSSFETPEQKTTFRNKVYDVIGHIQDPSLKTSYEIDFTARIKEQFRQLRPGQSYQTQPGSFSSTSTHKAGKTARIGLNVPDLQWKILVAAMINHPVLFADCEDQFLALESSQERLNLLREEMASVFFEASTIDTERLKHHLCSNGFKNEVESVCDWSVYTHARFAQPNEDLEAVKENWLRIWHFCHGKSALERDIETCKEQMASDPTIENFEKLKHLQGELAKLKV